jgi:hypothetical protein
MPLVILRMLAIVLAMAAGIAGVLWVVLELAGAVSSTGTDVWYVALGVTIAAIACVVIVTARSRTRGMIGLTVSMSVLFVAILLTYPSEKAPCTPGAGQGAAADPALEDAGIEIDDVDVPSASTDCK